MIYPISIVVYPLFGAWRAECETCGAYANSNGDKYKHPIAEALENLSKDPITFNDDSKKCPHHYGAYKPRVHCYVQAKDVKSIPYPRTISYEYVYNNKSRRYEPDFDAIASGIGRVTHVCVAHKYNLSVSNLEVSSRPIVVDDVKEDVGDEPTYEQNLAYAYEELGRANQQAIVALHAAMQVHEKNLTYLKCIAVCLFIFIASLFAIGTAQQYGGLSWLKEHGF